jgi:hypothetical protein
MSVERFEELARELTRRDRELAEFLPRAHDALAALRECAQGHVAAFVATVRRGGAPHLAELVVGPVEADEKHVDCVQFKVQRGRWEIVCVAKPRGVVTLVGPYRRGKAEQPCRDYPLPSEAAEDGLEELLLQLIRQACER